MAPTVKIILARPRGFCTGVGGAIDFVESALSIHGAPADARHGIVQNIPVAAALRDNGAVFLDDVGQIPEGAAAIFGAHGIAPVVQKQAAQCRLNVIDPPCPMVWKVHKEGRCQAQLLDLRCATQTLQNTVLALARHVDMLPVVDPANSSSSRRLREIGTRAGPRRHVIDDPSQLDPAWLEGMDVIGRIAGASAPEYLVRR